MNSLAICFGRSAAAPRFSQNIWFFIERPFTKRFGIAVSRQSLELGSSRFLHGLEIGLAPHGF